MDETSGTETPPEAEGEDTKKDDLNLNVSVEEISNVERRLDVEVPWEEVKKRQDEAFRELGKGVTLKGFRKGKVPRKMIVQLFGKHVDQEVAQRLVQESIDRAAKQVDVKPVGEPRLEMGQEGLPEGEAFKYSAFLEVLPEVEPRDYFGLEVKALRNPVSDQDVEASLLAKQREMTAYQAVEGRETAAGDVLLVDVMGKAGDEVIDIEQRSVELDDDNPTEPLPGLAAALTGLPCDQEEVDLALDLPVRGDSPAARANLLVTIHDVKQKVVPELDDDLAKDTGEAESLDQLRQVLRQKLEQQEQERAKDEARNMLIKAAVERNEIPSVPSLVERHLEQRIKIQKMLMGQDPEQAGPQDEALKDHLRPEAELTIKSGMLLDAIGKKEGVEVQEADVEQRLAEIANRRGQNAARVRAEYEKEGNLEALERRIREDKTLDLLESKANIIIEESTDQPPDAEAAEPPPDEPADAGEAVQEPEQETAPTGDDNK